MRLTWLLGGAPHADRVAEQPTPAPIVHTSIAEAVVAPRTGYLYARFVWLRALGLIFFSAFYALAFQIRGLIGDHGILPVSSYLYEVARAVPGPTRFWAAPTLLWISSSDAMLMAIVLAGGVAALLLTANVWPRATIALCTVLFVSCVAALQDFSAYQSDGMLLEAGFLSIFVAPRGIWPGLGRTSPPSRASFFLLQWEWFRIYFESGVVKLASGDPQWRTLTAMDHYYENGPLPTWLGWYAQQLPHWFHAGTALLTLVVELGVVWALWMPRRARIACFCMVTPLQIGIIATANYAFLNYLVLALGVLLIDDELVASISRRLAPNTDASPDYPRARRALPAWARAILYAWFFYATLVEFLTLWPVPTALLTPATLLRPFRIANSYGLFASMTTARYEIEFQGSRDGTTWTPYRFRYKPQDPFERPGIYAPYQPRFDWNLWFASLETWRASPWVVLAQARLLDGSPDVLALFREDPFRGTPPTQVRTVRWQYWFTDRATKRATGAWWRREELGTFAGTVVRDSLGTVKLLPRGSVIAAPSARRRGAVGA